MIARTHWLLRADERHAYIKQNGLYHALCLPALDALFEIPKEAKWLRLLAFSKPGKWRQKVKVIREDTITGAGILRINDGPWVAAPGWFTREYLRNVMNHTVYVECEYEF